MSLLGIALLGELRPS
ncbi:hypothetical protein VTL71DRAFT_9475 [Oculimacula yallundae]|uniref:Uncharacterized protein n=1 Tax=Oculimacula yallundae TaxID=86028 RepID=A0ABR4BS09_9HELO